MEGLLREGLATKRRRKGKPSPLSSISSPDDEEELCLVMQEIADALGAIAIVLTIQEHEEDQAEILRISDAGFNEQFVRRLHEEDAFLYDETTNDAHNWKSATIDGIDVAIMILPVKRTTGHQRMVISALFKGVDQVARFRAERVYLARRPFAIGYFRLWQIDRARQRREKALEAALNSFGVGVVLIDADANTVFANVAAQNLLLLGDGIKLDSGRIHATNLKDSVHLRAVLDHVTATGVREAPMLSIARASTISLTLLALPIEWEEQDIGAVAAVIYIIDPAADITAVVGPLCQIYQLTPSETKLACLLATGTSLVEAAEKMRVKEQTARSVLKQVFRKTGTTRQGELIALMFSSIVRAHPSVHIQAISRDLGVR